MNLSGALDLEERAASIGSLIHTPGGYHRFLELQNVQRSASSLDRNGHFFGVEEMKRGPKSNDDLAVIVNINEAPPPPAPSELTQEQAEVWKDAVHSMRGTWTRAAYPLLENYCRHVCRARELDGLIKTFKPGWSDADDGVARLDRLMRMAARESTQAIAVARALRLTPRSQITPRTAARRAVLDLEASDGPKPWDDE